MASTEYSECVDEALRLLNLLASPTREFILKKEQEIAVNELLQGKDVLAVLPTGFGKSFIFIVYLLARNEMSKRTQGNVRSCVLVVSPLKSIISDQISEVTSFNCTAAELSKETLSEIMESPPQFIYCSADSYSVLSFAFLITCTFLA